MGLEEGSGMKATGFSPRFSPERQDPANEQSKVKPARVGPEKLTSMRDRSFFVTLVGGLFFFSGFAALIYQVVWMRHLSLFFGSDVYAAASEASSLIQHRFITTSQEGMDIRFNCPRCGRQLSGEERGVGTTVNCPSCKEQIEIPSGTPPPPLSLPPPVPSVATVHPSKA